MSSADVPITLSIFDPLMSVFDDEVSCRYGMVRLPNLAGKYRTEGKLTLFYMPHCPYRLYNNILWANWDALDEVLILGNSFDSYLGGSIQRDCNDCVVLLEDVVHETCIWRDVSIGIQSKQFAKALDTLEYAFNDISLMNYPRKNLDLMSELLITSRPSEEEIDEATARDEEMALESSVQDEGCVLFTF